MYSRFVVFAGFVIFTASALSAEPTTRPARGDTLVVSAIIDAPADEIFECFKTSEGIVKAWGVAQAKVDFRVGGQIRTAYAMETDVDSPKAIVNTILAYIPGRMLVIKPTAPEGAPDWLQAICKGGWNVIELVPIGSERTRLMITGMGYEPGPVYDKAYSFFKQGNEWTLKKMQETLGHGDAKAKSQHMWEQLKARIGGDWIAEQTGADGAIFRARNRWEATLDDQVLVGTGWIGDASGLHAHATTIAWIDPVCGAVCFDQFLEGGHFAHGTFVSLTDDSLAMPLTVETGSEKPPIERYAVMRFIDSDNYRFNVFASRKDATDGGKPMVDVKYRRVSALPEEFKKIQPAS